MDKTKLTLEQLKEKLKQCDSGDYETDHVSADALLLDYIGDSEVKEIFNNIQKWYS